jgi:hypothetical protein
MFELTRGRLMADDQVAVRTLATLLCGSLLFRASSPDRCVRSGREDRCGEEGSRSFERQLALEGLAATAANVGIGDVNGDGHPDILLVRGRTDR